MAPFPQPHNRRPVPCFGIPAEGGLAHGLIERRVALSPAGVRELCTAGAQVIVQEGAGQQAGFGDDKYRAAGARVVYSTEEVYGRATVVLRVERPTEEEVMRLAEGSALIGFLHLHVAGPRLVRTLVEREITAVGLEAMAEDDGSFPLQKIASQITGRMAPQVAGHLLEATSGGLGVLLAGLPGIPPAEVVILGAGVLGIEAAQGFVGTGASVSIVDTDVRKLERVDQRFGGRVVTALATRQNIEKFVRFADVLIGAVRQAEAPAPRLVTRDMVRQMREGSVILDFAINEGGCVETSRLTPTEEAVFRHEGVLHYAVPNVPSLVPRTATYALTQALLPYLRLIISAEGVTNALRQSVALRRGAYLLHGCLTHPYVGREPDLPSMHIDELLQASR